jgi:transcriptional regulator with XRE-family HTH domain
MAATFVIDASHGPVSASNLIPLLQPTAITQREAVRCDYCKRVQFVRFDSEGKKKQDCKCCHKPLFIEEPEPEVVTVQETIPTRDGADNEAIDIAGNIREARHEKCLTQRQLADRLGVPRTYITKIENRKAVPTLSSLNRLAGGLELQLADLLNSKAAREKAKVLQDPFCNELVEEGIGKLDTLQRTMFLMEIRGMRRRRRITAV